jgi:hypothetical protein
MTRWSRGYPATDVCPLRLARGFAVGRTSAQVPDLQREDATGWKISTVYG